MSIVKHKLPILVLVNNEFLKKLLTKTKSQDSLSSSQKNIAPINMTINLGSKENE